MRLRDLDGQLIGRWHPKDAEHEHEGWSFVDSLADAQGVEFQCPKCAVGKEAGEEDGRRFVRGAHYVICWFANPRNAPRVPDDIDPKPGRWFVSTESTGLDDLTFTGPGAFSVLLTSGCGWHGYVKNGDAS